MSRTSILATALLVAALFGCQAVSPELAKDADDVEVSIEEADRAFLYSQVDAARLLQMARPAEEAVPPAHLYVYNSETRELREIARDEVPGLSYGDNGLLAVSVETHGASINLWNWNEGDVDRLELRLDGFSARLVEGDAGAYDVIFAAKEPAVFPLCKDKDYEIFKARIVAAQDGTAELLEFAQLTHNDVDDTQPAFSPDGHWIVFVSEPHGPRNVALMDAEGHYLRVLAPSAETSSYFPVVLPNNEECLYVSESNGITEFLICGLDGRGHRRASGQELKQMLFSWDDFTRHRYLMTDIFAREQSLRMLLDLPHTLDLLDLVLLAEWNSPMLKQYRQLVLAARAERVHNQKERSPKITIGGFQIVDTGVLVDESTTDPGDIPAQGFTRLLFTLSLPLFQGSLNKAIKQRDMWQEVVYSQTYLNNYNDLVQKVAVAYTDYSEQMARAAVLRRILDLNRKRRFLWEVRVGAGKELPGRLTEAESYISEAEAALTEAEGKAEAARARLLAALGVADMPPFEVEAATLDWEALPMEPPPLEEIQALAQINHPELARLKFLELRAAAIRDMGAPSARGQTSLDLTYGHGSEHFFSPTTDDYIGATLSHTLPLQKLGVDKAYREQWTHEMMAYREEREQARLDINAALQETEAALRRVTEQFEANQDWRRVTAEKLRLSRIYGAERVLAARGDRPYDVVDQIEAEIDHLNQQLVLTGVRAEFCRHLAQYYTRAGLGRKLLEVLALPANTELGKGRSVWLWRSLEVVMDPDKRDQVLRLCADQGISRIYCFVARVENDYYLYKHNWEFGYFLDLCAEQGIEVYALVGNPQWVDEASRTEIGSLVRSIVGFNARQQEGKAGFAGLKLDVEPHALPGWRDQAARARLVTAYLEMLDYVKAVLGQDGADLRIAADVPYTYLEVPVPGGEDALFATLCERVDELTLMAYLNTAESIVQKALPCLQVAQEHGTPLEVGVETTPDQPEGVSFADQSVEDLVMTLEKVYRHFMGFESFAGFAIHDYGNLAQLIERSHGH